MHLSEIRPLRLAYHTAAIVLFFGAASLQAQNLVTPCISASATDTFTTHCGIEYTQGVNGPLHADVYIPKGSGSFPGILFIHGGGWMKGDRSQMIKLIKALASQGYVSFTIDYDLTPTHYPASFNESLAALRFFRAHAAEYHLDPSRVAVAGSSAGGELAALVALNPEDITVPATEKPVETSSVQAAIILNGVLDLTAEYKVELYAKSKGPGMVESYIGSPCTKATDVCKDASPTSHIHSGAPSFYVGSGTADRTVPYAQAEAFVAGLRAAKVPTHFFTATDGPHTYWIKKEFFEKNLVEIEEFLKVVLRKLPNGSVPVV